MTFALESGYGFYMYIKVYLIYDLHSAYVVEAFIALD